MIVRGAEAIRYKWLQLKKIGFSHQNERASYVTAFVMSLGGLCSQPPHIEGQPARCGIPPVLPRDTRTFLPALHPPAERAFRFPSDCFPLDGNHLHSEFSGLTGNADAEVCIIGAGIAGLTTASLFALEGRKVIVVDGHTVAIEFIVAFARDNKVDCDFKRIWLPVSR